MYFLIRNNMPYSSDYTTYKTHKYHLAGNSFKLYTHSYAVILIIFPGERVSLYTLKKERNTAVFIFS